MTDIDFGISATPVDSKNIINVTSEKLTIRHHTFDNVGLQAFISNLITADIRAREPQYLRNRNNGSPVNCFSAEICKKITVQRLFHRLVSFITLDTIVIADIGDSLFGALDLVIHRDTEFLGSAFYASMGFAVPACIGSQLANPKLRLLVIVGDGAFQMTGMEISTAVRYHLNSIIVLLNNRGYGTERRLLDGPFNDLQPWQYNAIPEIVEGKKAFSSIRKMSLIEP